MGINDLLHSLAPAIGTLLLVVGLVVAEPDMGTACMISLIAFVMLFVSGLSLRYVAGAIAAALPIVYLLIVRVPYRLQRVQTFFSPGSDPQGHGFQLLQSLISVGSGGFTGVGLMESHQKLFFLPEAHTDFIFAVICEEMGFIGAVIVLGLFAVYGWRGFAAAMKAPDPIRQAARHRDHHDGSRAGAGQLERGAGPAADQGDSAAVRELWRIEFARNASGNGRAFEHQPARGRDVIAA